MTSLSWLTALHERSLNPFLLMFSFSMTGLLLSSILADSCSLKAQAWAPIPFCFFPSTIFPGLVRGVSLSNSICPLRGSEKLQTDICQLIICSFERFLCIRRFQRKHGTSSVNASGGMGSHRLFVLRLTQSLSQQLWTVSSPSTETHREGAQLSCSLSCKWW